MAYWNALKTLNQVAGEIGLPRTNTITGLSDVQSVQLLSLLNAAGSELLTFYPWEQFAKEFLFTIVPNIDSYPVPADYKYFTDQTQWDRTNHWPLLGPKSPQEWAFIKGSLVAPLPRIRYRIQNNQIKTWPILTTSSSPSSVQIAMEYISENWVSVDSASTPTKNEITADSDILFYDPWLLVKAVKVKWYELKGLSTAGVQADYLRAFYSLTGKDTGAEILSLSRKPTTNLITINSVPDGSWNVNP